MHYKRLFVSITINKNIDFREYILRCHEVEKVLKITWSELYRCQSEINKNIHKFEE